MLFRLYTEKSENLPEIVNQYFNNFSIVNSTGFYQGKQENSQIIEIVNNKTVKPKIKKLAENIKQVNNQDSVLLQELENNSETI